MTNMDMMYRGVCFLTAAILTTACSPSDSANDGAGGSSSSGLNGFSSGAGAGGPAGQVYANTGDALYLFEPFSQSLSLIGKFNCVDVGTLASDQWGMGDIAVTADGQMMGVGRPPGGDPSSDDVSAIFSIDPLDATCTQLADVSGKLDGGEALTGLGLAPKGTVDQDEEVLLGLTVECKLFRIDVTDASVSLIGDFGSQGPGEDMYYWHSCTDLVSIDGFDTFATATRASTTGGHSHLVQINVSTGEYIEDRGIIGTSGVNLGFWAGTLYGFAIDGNVFGIDPAAPTDAALGAIQIGTELGQLKWYGAGVTTVAPITPPK